MQASAADADTPSHPWRLVCGIGVGQIVSWGALFYTMGVLGPAIGADLSLSQAGVFGAFSLGLLISGLVAPAVGRAIDRHGGRVVLSAGSAVSALALFALAWSPSAAAFYLAWCIGGVAMAMKLYDPAFVTLAQHFGSGYRRAVTIVTLFGGLASTVAWPLSLAGLDAFGWRTTLAGFGAVELLLAVPLHLYVVPRRRAHAERSSRGGDAAKLVDARDPRFAALTAAFALNSFIAGALAAHMPGVLAGSGLTAADAVLVGSAIGPMQVAGRLLDFGAAGRWRAVTAGRLALAAFAGALLLLLALYRLPGIALAFAFAATYGASNGVTTIVRGAAPAELFGRERFGALIGRIAAPSFVARAVAPVTFAVFAADGGRAIAGLFVLLALAIASLTLFSVAARGRG